LAYAPLSSNGNRSDLHSLPNLNQFVLLEAIINLLLAIASVV
jgi:hypothetical protein